MPRNSSETPIKIAVFGGKGGGAHAAQTILNLTRAGRPYSFAGYLNDRLPTGSPLHCGKVLGNFDAWPNLDKDLFFITPMHKVGFMQQNCSRIIRLGIPASRLATLIDPWASVADYVSIGPGSYVAPFASIGMDSMVGSHCAIRHGARVGNDVAIGDFVFLGSNAILCSGAKIQFGAHIAPGAKVLNGVSVGRFAVVGLGAVITKDVADYAVIAGNPARLLRKIDPIEVPAWSFWR